MSRVDAERVKILCIPYAPRDNVQIFHLLKEFHRLNLKEWIHPKLHKFKSHVIQCYIRLEENIQLMEQLAQFYVLF